ncbi:exodeoxyribonuclease III [Clostridium sp. 19966]|uniref:exodeoxyribonuclease III n=1 Tax=Clostridium sp. 19966 TaxID=2768166 RepID=UPI0028DF418A|nr:exodeoxyribonuclease III [Clostridium sp. 19966]MDT8716605.1 exodeoxyribonuclease III [Clostridium sp. 19966]
MEILSWNVNGLRAVMKKNFKEWLLEASPDILCIQETKLQENQLIEDITNIGEYKSYYSFAEKKGYSGVATYTKAEPKAVRHGIGIEEFDCEGRILITEFEDFELMNIYFPNGQRDEERLDYKLRFYDALLDFANGEVKAGKKLVICGDYNTAHTEMDIKNAKANEKTSGFLPIERAWIDKFIGEGYTDVFRKLNPDTIKYSWWSYMFKARERNTGWRIDYHFVSNNLMDNVAEADILNEVMGSDHCPVSIKLNL